MEVKICGLTKPKEAEYLNEAGADYAGFVFFEKSKRNVTIEQALEVMECLDRTIKKVAVTVSPDIALFNQIEEAGFQILQVHKYLDPKILNRIHIPIWYAINIADEGQLKEKLKFLEELPVETAQKITAIVVDGAEYGSGKTFDWTKSSGIQRKSGIFRNRKFILAGGLSAENVTEGMERFVPDIVDVSSGVEGADGKDKDKINAFIRKVKRYE